MTKKPLSKLCEDAVERYFNRNKSTVCTRFADTHDTFQGRGHGVTLSAKPSDFIITDNGTTFYAEVKSTTSQEGITGGLFKQQAARRDRLLKAGALYLYFVYSEALDCWFSLDGIDIADNPNRKWGEIFDRQFEELSEFCVEQGIKLG